jgi:hypothetical protein
VRLLINDSNSVECKKARFVQIIDPIKRLLDGEQYVNCVQFTVANSENDDFVLEFDLSKEVYEKGVHQYEKVIDDIYRFHRSELSLDDLIFNVEKSDEKVYAVTCKFK